MTPDAQVDAVKAALAEAGYPDADVWWGPDSQGFETVLVERQLPPEAVWRAYAIVGIADECWSCWSSCFKVEPPLWDVKNSCDHDWRTEPWPPVPERAL